MPYIGNSVQNQGFAPAIDYFNGNGVTVTFTLSRPLASVAQIICAIDNVIQNPSSAFNVSGNAITFTSAPLSGTNNIWVEYTSLITTYAAISQDPSVIGDITASGGYLATGDFGNSYIDGVIVDYVTGAARLTTGPLDDMVFYHGGSSARSEMMRLSYAGNSTLEGALTTTGKITVNSPNGIAINAATPALAMTDSTWAVAAYMQPGVNTGGTGTGNYFMTNVPTGKSFTWAVNNSSQMQLDSSGNLLFNSGYGSVATAYACRAWVNFNGTGTVAIRASGNVSSITDLGVGNYTVNFTNAISDTNYSVFRCDSNYGAGWYDGNPNSTTYVTIKCANFSATLQDANSISVAIFR